MWKVNEDGTREEITGDIYYMQHLIAYFNNLIIGEVIKREEFYNYYKTIMSLPDRDDRMEAVVLVNDKLSINESPSQNFKKIVASVMKKYKNKSKVKDADLEDKEIIETLYDIAKILRTEDFLLLYIFYMEMLAVDKEERAKEVEHAYQILFIDRLKYLGLLADEEESKKVAEIGESYLLERVCKVLEWREE